MILKILLVLAVIGIVYFIFIKKKPSKVTKKESSKKKDELKANDMVECATCGVYSELQECTLSDAKYYCSAECVTKAS